MSRRKKSSHRAILLHFHEDGNVCPESFGQTCPQGGVHSGNVENISDPKQFFNKLPNGFNINNLSQLNNMQMAMAAAQDPELAVKMAAMGIMPGGAGGGGGMPAFGGGMLGGAPAFGGSMLGGAPAFGGGMLGGGADIGLLAGGDPQVAMMLAAQAAASGGGADGGFFGGGGGGGMDAFLYGGGGTDMSTSGAGFNYSAFAGGNFGAGGEDVAPNSLAVPGAVPGTQAGYLGLAAMAKSTIDSGTPSAIAALAKMAAANGNVMAAQALSNLASMAASNGLRYVPPNAIMQIMAKTGLGGPVAIQAAMQAAMEVEKTITPDKKDAAEKYQALIVKQAANVQMSKAIANSALAKMSDSEVKVMTDGKFASTAEFIQYMQSADTDVSKLQLFKNWGFAGRVIYG